MSRLHAMEAQSQLVRHFDSFCQRHCDDAVALGDLMGALAVEAFSQFWLVLFWRRPHLLSEGIWTILHVFCFPRFRRVDFHRLGFLTELETV